MTRWETIPGFSRYEISEYGVIRRSLVIPRKGRGIAIKPGEFLARFKQGKYYSVNLYADGTGKPYKPCKRRVHVLIALAFHGPRPKGAYALHRNDVSDDNHYSNIYWGTQLQNMKDWMRNRNALQSQT